MALKYTSRVINEVLRLYPPFWMIDRVAVADDEIAGVNIPAGVMVIPYIYGAHRNPEIWDQPSQFDPSRFTPDQMNARPQMSYIPFGGGPRVCIGNSMAMLTILLILATFIRRYDFVSASSSPVGIQPMMLLRPDGPVLLRLQPR
jgi:cytochrome P450